MNTRDRILGRLMAAQAKGLYPVPEPEKWCAADARREASDGGAIRFQTMIEAAHAEVHRVTDGDWVQKLFEVMAAKRLINILLAPATPHGLRAREGLAATGIECLFY